MIRGICVLLAVACVTSLPVAAPKCGDEYYVGGMVQDRAGQPLSDARVWVLLDKISENKTLSQGIRARRGRTDRTGTFSIHLICGGENGGPNPCAKRPKQLTMAAGGAEHGLKLKVFRLKDLEVVERDGVCFVQAPAFAIGAAIR